MKKNFVLLLCTFISSHTFAKEFDYICSQTEDGFIMYFTVNTTDKTIFHKFSREENQRYEINKKLEVLNWNFPRVFKIDELTLDSIFIRYLILQKNRYTPLFMDVGLKQLKLPALYHKFYIN